jgi:predicted TIM-barrel fold metal-dependent hydrolase
VLDSEGQKLRDLHLCLAHFGGPTDQGREWSEQIIDMMMKYPNFYADISSSFASGDFRKHFEKVIGKHKHWERIKERVLFGTDWYMTLLYTFPFHGMNYWDYCTKTKDFLDEIDPGLWPRFTMHNPYRFYRLSDQVPRIAASITARKESKKIKEKTKKETTENKTLGIQKEAAWLRQANDGFNI